MALSNNIVLRPSFKLEASKDSKSIFKAFEASKFTSTGFIIDRTNDTLFIRPPKQEQHFWSPQLELKVKEKNHSNCELLGVFGPNPKVWNLFMLLHFIVAALFVAFSIWAYTNWNNNKDYTAQINIMIIMVLLWAFLYFAGRLGKQAGKTQMEELHEFINRTLTA